MTENTYSQRELKTTILTISEKMELMDKNGFSYYILKFNTDKIDTMFAFSRKGKIGDKWHDNKDLEWCMELTAGDTYEFTYYVSDRGTPILYEWRKVNEFLI